MRERSPGLYSAKHSLRSDEVVTRERIAELNAMIGKENPPEPSPTPLPKMPPTPDPIFPNKKWEYKAATNAVDPQPGGEISKRLGNGIAAQLKRDGKSEEKLEKKGLYLRFIQMDIKPDRWIDSNTALLYGGEGEMIAERDDPGEMSDGFSANFLFTLKFDDAGKWKIVKTQRLSEKEVRQREQ
jgi:hypothetical protein